MSSTPKRTHSTLPPSAKRAASPSSSPTPSSAKRAPAPPGDDAGVVLALTFFEHAGSSGVCVFGVRVSPQVARACAGAAKVMFGVRLLAKADLRRALRLLAPLPLPASVCVDANTAAPANAYLVVGSDDDDDGDADDTGDDDATDADTAFFEFDHDRHPAATPARPPPIPFDPTLPCFGDINDDDDDVDVPPHVTRVTFVFYTERTYVVPVCLTNEDLERLEDDIDRLPGPGFAFKHTDDITLISDTPDDVMECIEQLFVDNTTAARLPGHFWGCMATTRDNRALADAPDPSGLGGPTMVVCVSPSF